MLSVVVKYTFVISPLFVALIRLSYAQDDSGTAETSSVNTSVCSQDEFQCQSQECIQNQLLCDGRADCSDSSDETEYECAKPELVCPIYAFRCGYGACIDRDLTCDDQIDCIADGSDEIACPTRIYAATSRPPLSFATRPLPQSTMTPITSRPFKISSPFPYDDGSSLVSDFPRPNPHPKNVSICRMPFSPTNGLFKRRKFMSNGDFKDVDPQDSEVEVDTVLMYSCAPGYRLRGAAHVRCQLFGKWSRKPVCIDITCYRNPMQTSRLFTMEGNYTDVNGKVTPIDNVVPKHIKTMAQVTCRPGYRKSREFPLSGSENVECTEAGKWMPEPISCVPVCGIANRNQRPSENSGSGINIGTLPWHAELHVQRNSLNKNETIFRCSATVIRANLLLTGAHCLYDLYDTVEHIFNSSIKAVEVLEDFFVLTGNDRSATNHNEPVRVHKVKNIHTTCRFYDKAGFFAKDIALIELQDSLEFSDTLLPACVDEIGPDQHTLQFGRDSCADEKVHDGGGLVYNKNNIWYVFGIVSEGGDVKWDGSQSFCNRRSNFVYTKVANHIRWIRQVISDLEHSKYPPCSRYLPPFHKTPPTTRALEERLFPITPSEFTWKRTSMLAQAPTMPTDSLPIEFFGPMDHSCPIPPQPINGKWRLHRDFCKSNVDCDVRSGTAALGFGSQLVYSCAPGYKAKGNTDVYCRANSKWSAIPVCDEIRCRPINSESTIATCFRLGESVDCSYPVLPNTTAKVSCRTGYGKVLTTRGDTLECNTNGDWEPEFPTCVSGLKPIFHVAIYAESN